MGEPLARDEVTVTAVALRLRRYLQLHPDAADTVDGIERLWIAPLALDRGVQVAVQRALALLVAEGSLTERRHSDGTVLYAAPRTERR